MLETRIACPTCGKRLKSEAEIHLGDRFRCPRCRQVFHVQAKDFLPASAAVAAASPEIIASPPPPPVLSYPVAQPWVPPPPPAPAPLQAAPPPRRSSRIGLFVGLAACLLALGVGLVIGLSGGDKPKEEPTPLADTRPTTDEKPKSDLILPKKEEPKKEPTPPADEKKEEKQEPVKFRPPTDERRVEKDVPPARPALSPEKQEKVNQAIERGVVYLRRHQQPGGTWATNPRHALGLAALPGLTLVECGVPATDPAVRRALAYVRSEAPANTFTYDISLSILFLDRVGDPADRRLIQKLALRLMAGQQATGGWSYRCHDVFEPLEELALFEALNKTRPKSPLDLFEQDRGNDKMKFFVESLPQQDGTTAHLERPHAAALSGLHFGQGPPKVFGTITSTARNANSTPLEELKPLQVKVEELPPRLRDLPMLKPVPPARDLPSADRGERTDNSNTQFAILGVWAAARHGIPMEQTLAMLVKRFRLSQNRDGTWGYHYGTNGQTHGSPSMAGVGLLGLAVGHGLIAGSDPTKSKPVLKDPAIEKGLAALSRYLDADEPPPVRGGPKGKRNPRQLVKAAAANCYFLWTLERVGILYNLTSIGETNWYEWCVEVLLPRQNPDGSWAPGVGGFIHADTSQALLVLKRANLTRDLTARINFMRLKDDK